jgi:hypothetical protein
MKKFVISESQEKVLKKILNEETYQMPVDKKANKPFCINPDKVLIVKKFLDKGFTAHDYEKIGSNGMPIRIKVVSMNASNGEPLKYMYKDQLHDLLVDRFQNMFLDAVERSAFMGQVLNDWLNNKIGIFGNLSTNRIVSENTSSKDIDKLANEANPNPTDGQKEAGNYKMGHVRIKGFPISIETPKGTTRIYKGEDGKEGKKTLVNHYGYFTNTTGNGKDGDAIDVFIGNYIEDCTMVYVVDQNNPQGEFDESKVMLGFKTKTDAKKAYFANFSKDWKGFREITCVPIETFRKWLYRKHKQRKPFAEYALIQRTKLHEGLLREEDYNEIKKISSFFDEKAANEVVEEIESMGIDAYAVGKTVYIMIERDPNDPHYVDDIVRHCKELAFEYISTHKDREQMEMLREELMKK